MFSLLKDHSTHLILKTKQTTSVIRRIKKIHFNKLSTKVAVVDDGERGLQRTIDKITKATVKEFKKKPQKPPFAKNLFLGVFDTDILAYPEVLNKTGVDDLEKDILPIKDYFENINDRQQKGITKNYLQNLSDLKLLGLQVPNFDGGRQLTVTETCRYLEEMSKNTSQIGVIDNEQLGIQLLLKHGTKNHKKYLEQLLNGQTVISFCVSETGASNSQTLNTRATLSPDNKTWLINGTKNWIVNGDLADLFIVFAETGKLNQRGRENIVCAFIVERSFGGIKSTQCETMGLEQTDICNITFENTPVPAENLIGKFEVGNALISSILNEYRISRGPVCITLLKRVINKFTNYCIEIDENDILKTNAIQFKIGELVTMLYAIESITYLTTGLMDQYEKQDCELEAAIVKLASTNYCYTSIAKVMDFMGTSTYMKDNWCNQLYRDSLGHVLLSEPVDNLKLTIALMGLQHTGIILQDKIRVTRNPLFHPAAAFKRMWTHKRHIEDNPKLTLKLHEYLHPSALTAAQYLEYSVLRLQFATEALLSRHGAEVITKHIELQRLADCITDIYMTTAVLGRASRSYCIGLRHAAMEMELAIGFSVKAMERVKENVRKIWIGTYNTADEKYLQTGKYSIKQKGYFPAHPLSRNF